MNLQHVCTDACGITPDPGCPFWKEPEYPRGSREWLLYCTPLERREYDLGCDLRRLLWHNRELLIPTLISMLGDDIVELIRETVAHDLGGEP